MNFVLSVMTCAGREAALARTLESIRLSDWGAEPIVVHDTLKHQDRKLSQVNTAKAVLDQVAGYDWDYLVFAEDDVLVNKHLRHNLERWSPVRAGFLLVGTLYQSAPVVPVTPDYGLAPCRLIGGSQAVVISRTWFPELVKRWHGLTGEGMQDLRMFRSVEAVFPFVPVHTPNLVQHQAGPSTWGGGQHASASFSPDWRA